MKGLNCEKGYGAREHPESEPFTCYIHFHKMDAETTLPQTDSFEILFKGINVAPVSPVGVPFNATYAQSTAIHHCSSASFQ